MPFLPVNGINLYYETHGSGPAVVFAHGSGGNHLSWWQQVPFFARYYTVLTFDHRSFGYSKDGATAEQRVPESQPSPSPQPPSTALRTSSPFKGEGAVPTSSRAQFADDLKGLLDHLGIGQAAIVAQSMGGRTAVGFALRNPGRARAIVLAGSNGGSVNDESRRIWDEQQERNRALPKGSIRGLYSRFTAEHPERVLLYRKIMRMNPKHPRDFLRVPPGYRGSTHERLAAEGVPILYLVGEQDVVAPPRTIEIAAAQIPGSRLVRVPEAGHSVYFEQPERFNEIVLDFLREVYPPH
jgi:pimeloyl-ACP methyl ester carboxylesterase